jgi:hypothetical protein
VRRTAVASILPFAALSFVACDTAGPEEGADVEDVVEDDGAVEETPTGEGVVGPYDGVYDRTFYDDYDSYMGEEVTVSAQVNEIITPMSFTIAGTDDTTVEALLIIHQGEVTELADDLTVAVTGTVKEAFDLPTVEEEMGIDLDDNALADWDQARYIEATSIDTSVDADAE